MWIIWNISDYSEIWIWKVFSTHGTGQLMQRCAVSFPLLFLKIEKIILHFGRWDSFAVLLCFFSFPVILTIINMVLHPSSESLNSFYFLQLANPISVDTVVAAISSAALWKNIKNAVITTCKPWVSQAIFIQVIKVSIWGLTLSGHVLRKRISEGTAVPFVASFVLERQCYA